MTRTKLEVAAFAGYFDENGFESTHQDQAATDRLRQSWRAMTTAIPHEGPDRRETPRTRGFDWEIFSGGNAVFLQGEDAISSFKRHARGDYFIWPQVERAGSLAFRNQAIPGIDVLENARLVRGGFLADLYLSSAQIHWTFVLTHERDWGCGPYYAEAAWQQKYKPGPLTMEALRRGV